MKKKEKEKNVDDVSRYIDEGNPNTNKVIEKAQKKGPVSDDKPKPTNAHNQLQVLGKK
jgi:hypothetical protein